jgi:hypothetical protein
MAPSRVEIEVAETLHEWNGRRISRAKAAAFYLLDMLYVVRIQKY